MGRGRLERAVGAIRRSNTTRLVRLASPIVTVAAVVVALGSSAASTRVPRASTAQIPLTRYSLVHGCYALRSLAGGVAPAEGPYRMQAAALGIYLLYGPRGDYLTDNGTGTLQGAGAPSTAAEWRVDGGASQGFAMTNLGTAMRLPVTFVPASGCAQYPEAQVDATGPAFTGASPEADVLGTVEGHAHVTAFEFFGGDWHCGAPWSPFGAPYALPADCSPDQQGTNGAFESVIDFGGPTRPSDMHGWPTFREWPSPTALAEEGDYYTGIERAWKAGLRLMVTNLVDNEALCSVMTTRHNPCDDMASVRIQSHDLYALQDYIDAQSGGPGQGWFRIVTDPFQARQVINEGKLAVIEGIEVSRIFGCGEQYDVPQCDRAQIDAGLKEVHDLGVRTFFPIHEFDNAFGGTKMIAGGQGAVVNAGNRKETGSFWTVQPCPAEEQDAPQLTSPASSALAQPLNGVVATLAHGNPVPVYPPGPHCNVHGLTDLGAYVIRQMINQHFLIQLDHMSSKSATAAVSIAEGQHYSGLISAHCCSSPQLFARIYATGGFISPPVSPAAAFAAQGKVDKAVMDPRYHFGFGWGSDENGLGDQPGPASATPISYPFKSFDGGVTFAREQWGQRTFDLNTDGLANYGMYADWLQELQQVGGRPLMTDMFQGAEAYLQTWERASGVPAMSCRPAGERFTSGGLGSSLQLGQSTVTALYRAGQPLARPGRSYRYCVTGPAGRAAAVIAVFSGSGQVSMVASTAAGDLAGRIGPGSLIRHLRRRLRRVLPGVWVTRTRRATRRRHPRTRYVYGISRRRVRFVAVTTASDLRSKAQLRSDLQAAGV